jgi:hypothetical protein
MRRFLIAGAFTVVSTSSAFAWSSDMTQPNDPNSPMMSMAYNTKNYCPAGLQPIVMGGVVCCGVPAMMGKGD